MPHIFYDHCIAEYDYDNRIWGDVLGLQFGNDSLMREGDRREAGESNLEVAKASCDSHRRPGR